jgi:hypothetical protein
MAHVLHYPHAPWETKAHLSATGMPSQQNKARDMFRVRRAALYQSLKSKVGGSQSSDVEDQPQCRGIRHINSPSAPSLSSSPSSPPPSFTQSPSLQRSLMRVGQTSPQRPLLVFSRSLHYPLPPREKLYNHYPLSPCEQVILGTAVINTHTKHHSAKSKVRLTWTRGSVQSAKLFSYV